MAKREPKKRPEKKRSLFEKALDKCAALIIADAEYHEVGTRKAVLETEVTDLCSEIDMRFTLSCGKVFELCHGVSTENEPITTLMVDGECLEFLMKDMPRIYEGLKRVMES